MVMAAFSSCPLFTPPSLTCSELSFPSTPPILSLSSTSETKLFAFRLCNYSDTRSRLLSLSSSFRRLASSKFSGSRPDDDQPVDVSSIKSDNVRLIDGEQNMVGVVSKSRALQLAEEAELDLVVVSPDADPPVVRIMDFDKYRYEQQKKKREQQKKSAASRQALKELKMGYNIDSHDYSVRLKAAKKFLNDGDKVKIIVNLKGRENQFRDIAINLLKKFQTDVGELGAQESKDFRERNIYMVLIPNKATLQKAQEAPKKKDKLTANEVSAGM
ncbi:hypothetical protein V2J09_017981 [Rumex salicifolius]